MNPKRPRSPAGDTPSLPPKPMKMVYKRNSFHPTKVAETGTKDSRRAERPIAMVHKEKDEMKAAKQETTMRKLGRLSTKVHMAADGELVEDTVTRKFGRRKATTNYNVDDAYSWLDRNAPEEDVSAMVVPRNEAQHSSISRVEESDDWDTDDEKLLQTSCDLDRKLYRFCQEKYGVVPDQLLPDGEYINEAGPGLYTRNWSQHPATAMLLLLHCPIFQDEPGVLQYAISLAMYHRLPVREIPCSKILFTTPGVYRNQAFTFVEKILEVVKSKNKIYAYKKQGVLTRDLSAVVDGWNRWVIEEAARVRAWNKTNPSRLKETDQLYKELEYYQNATQRIHRSRNGPEFDAPLRFKKTWIIAQRKKYPRPQKDAVLARAANTNEQELIVKSQPTGGAMVPDDTTEDKYMRTAPNSISYLDLTIDNDDEEDDNYWDTGDEILLQKTSSLNLRLLKLCYEKFGLMPDQLLPDGEVVAEEGRGSYTGNWSESITKEMTLLVLCPIFQEDSAFLKYSISLAMYYRLPGRERPSSKILFEAPEEERVCRFEALAFIKNIKSAVKNLQAWSSNKDSGVVLRDLSAVVQSWNSWVAAERVSLEEWNLEHPDDVRCPEYEEAEKYQNKYPNPQGAEEKEEFLRLKRTWIISQRKDLHRGHTAELGSEDGSGSDGD